METKVSHPKTVDDVLPKLSHKKEASTTHNHYVDSNDVKVQITKRSGSETSCVQSTTVDNSTCGEDLLPSKVTVDIIDDIGYNSHMFEDIMEETLVSGGDNRLVMWNTTIMSSSLKKKHNTFLHLQVSSPHVKLNRIVPNFDLRGSNRAFVPLSLCFRR